MHNMKIHMDKNAVLCYNMKIYMDKNAVLCYNNSKEGANYANL